MGHRSDYSGPVSSNGSLEDDLKRYLEDEKGCGSSTPSSSSEKIEQLRRLRDKGLITPEEFQRKQKSLAAD